MTTYSFWELFLYSIWIYGMGLMLGYILWAPTTHFKSGFLDGLLLGPLVRYIQRKLRK